MQEVAAKKRLKLTGSAKENDEKSYWRRNYKQVRIPFLIQFSFS